MSSMHKPPRSLPVALCLIDFSDVCIPAVTFEAPSPPRYQIALE